MKRKQHCPESRRKYFLPELMLIGLALWLPRPDGTPIKVMPFESLAKMSDVDSQALYEYLKTVAPRPAGDR